MKIVYVCHEYPPRSSGGIGAFVQTLARALAAEGHAVRVVGLDREAGERDDEGVRVVTLPHTRGRGLRWWRDRRRLLRWLRAERPDLVEVPDYRGWLPFPLGKCPVIVRLHSTESVILAREGAAAPGWVRYCERATLRRHRHWAAFDPWFADRTAHHFGLRPRRLDIVPPLLPAPAPDESAGLPQPYVLYAGTVSKRKGALVVAEAMGPVLEGRPDLHLVFAGRTALDADEIYARAGRARVHLTGALPRERVLAAMRDAAAFAFVSPIESYGLVVDEALLAGAPVVTLDHPLFRRRIRHAETGLLVPEGDPGALRAALRGLLEDPEGARRLAERGQAEARGRCDPPAVLRAQVAAYERATDVGVRR